MTVPAVEHTRQRETARTAKVDALETDLRVWADGRRNPPASATPHDVQAARKALPRHGTSRIDLLSEGRKKVTLQVEKLVGERITALTKPLTAAVPILEPLLQAFAEAADKTVQERIGRSYDRVTQAAMRDPRDLKATVAREAKAVLVRTDVRQLVQRATPRAQQRTDALRQRQAALLSSNHLIDQRVAEVMSRQPPSVSPLRELPLLELPRIPEIYPPSYPYGTTETYRYPQTYRPPELGDYGRAGRIAPPRPVVPEVPRIVPFW